MDKTIRKAILFGLGVFQISREKIEEFVTELQKDGEITPEEGKKVVNEVMKKLDSEGTKLTKKVNQAIDSALKEIRKQNKAKTAGKAKDKSATTKK